MSDPIKRVPMPICGVMVGAAGLGNLLQSYSEVLRGICGVFSLFLLTLIIMKLCKYPQDVKKDFQNPITAGVSGTCTMGLMLLATYIKPSMMPVAFGVWCAAVILHFILIVYFTAKFVCHFELKNVFTVWYIVYVGIATAAVSAPAFGQEVFGTFCFWFGFVSLIVLLILVTVRYVKIPVPDPAKPLICIYAAPMSLCVAGYVGSVAPKSVEFLLGMCLVANLIYVFALIQSFHYITKRFYPSWAAFTFPFVITAIATKQTVACAAKLGIALPWLQPIALVETIIAVIFEIIVYARYMQFIFGNPKQQV